MLWGKREGRYESCSLRPGILACCKLAILNFRIPQQLVSGELNLGKNSHGLSECGTVPTSELQIRLIVV